MVDLSIIIPSFNRARLLERALRSCERAASCDFEIILVDDGSTDNTQAVVESAAKALPITLVRHANGANRGVSASRNLGLSVSRGTLVSFLDSDDELLPGRFDAAWLLMSRYQAIEAVWDSVSLQDADGRMLSYEYMGNWSQTIEGTYFRFSDVRVPPTLSLTVRRSSMLKCGDFDVGKRVGEDYEVWLRVIYGLNCAYSASPTPVAVIHKHDGNTPIGNAALIEVQAISDAREWFRRKGDWQAFDKLSVRLESTLYYYVSRYLDKESSLPLAAVKLLGSAAAKNPDLLLRRRYWGNVTRGLFGASRRVRSGSS